jgi:plasmid maintenance system antidote protein VapI
MGEFNPDWASPPGDTIKDLMEEQCITLEQLANGIGLSVSDTNLLIEGLFPVTKDIAKALEKELGPSEKFWLRRQYQFSLHKARIALASLKEYSDLWLKHGVRRVYEVYDKVDAEWLDEF